MFNLSRLPSRDHTNAAVVRLATSATAEHVLCPLSRVLTVQSPRASAAPESVIRWHSASKVPSDRFACVRLDSLAADTVRAVAFRAYLSRALPIHVRTAAHARLMRKALHSLATVHQALPDRIVLFPLIHAHGSHVRMAAHAHRWMATDSGARVPLSIQA